MIIKLYKNNSEKNKLNKALSSELTLNGTLRESCSVINPSLNIEGENLSSYNYMYIEEFNRYYYIDDITSIKNGLWRITGKVDVLMSYKDSILNTYAIIDKQKYGENSNRYYDDGSYISEVKTFIETKEFERGFNNDANFILITAGALPTTSGGGSNF